MKIKKKRGGGGSSVSRGGRVGGQGRCNREVKFL